MSTSSTSPKDVPIIELEEPKNQLDPDFSFLVDELLEKISKTKERKNNRSVTELRQHVVLSFVKQYRIFIGPNFYPAARLIFPDKDKRVYHIKDKTLARFIFEIYNIPKTDEYYKRVIEWKKTNNNRLHLPQILHDATVYRSIAVSQASMVSYKLTIDQLNALLDEMAHPEISGSAQKAILIKIINGLTHQEIKWVYKIILKESMLSRQEKFLLRSWNPDVPALLDLVCDLQRVFYQLSDPNKRLTSNQLTVSTFLPFLPELAKRSYDSYDKIALNFKNDFYIEEKLDGERSIMHFNNDEFKIFSRKAIDYTYLYGSNFEQGALTSHLRDVFPPSIKEIILDGELVAYDYSRDMILPFGTLKASAVQEHTRKFLNFEEQSSQPFYIVYDVLRVNGKSLLNVKLSDRRKILAKAIQPVKNRLEIVHYYRCSTGKEIEIALKDCIKQRSEGIIIKKLESPYVIGERRPEWVKLKPEYLEEYGENLDLCVIGVIPGIKQSYICGLKDENGCFLSFCTVANGFTVEEYKNIERMTTGKWHDINLDPPPPEKLRFGSKIPDRWILPEDSFVLEVRARSIDNVAGKSYAVGSTLLHLYARAIREDKSCHDSETLEQYRESRKANREKRGIEMLEDGTVKHSLVVKRKKRKAKSLQLEKPKVQVSIKCELFKNYVFLILTDMINEKGTRITIEQIEELIKKFGGLVTKSEYVQIIGEQTLILLGEKLTRRTDYCHRQGGFDIIKHEWIFQCIRANLILPLEPSLIFLGTNELITNCKRRIDIYGDSYYVDVSGDWDKYFSTIHVTKRQKSSEKGFLLHQSELLNEISVMGLSPPLIFLFQSLNFFIYDSNKETEPLERKIARFSGKITQELQSASFIIIQNIPIKRVLAKRASEDIARHIKINSKGVLDRIPRIVDESFIVKCIENNCIVDPQGEFDFLTSVTPY